jgi:2-haloalkanoic acid dehalogenase type II
MIKVIVFDLWNTLIHNTCTPTVPQMVKQELGLTGMDQNEFVRNYDKCLCTKPLLEIGEALQDLAKQCGTHVDKETKEKIMRQMEALRECVAAYPDTMPTLIRLKKKGLQLAVLSNTMYLGLEYALKKVPLYDVVDQIVTSYDEQAIKPEPAMFKAVERRFGVKANEILMVGDNEHNDVDAARKAGWHAILIDRMGRHKGKNTIIKLDEMDAQLEQMTNKKT